MTAAPASDTATTGQPIACPRCTTPMQPLRLSSHQQQPVVVDHCPDCRLVWFDRFESVRLDGQGWVRLLREMQAGTERPLADARRARPGCPACAQPLKAVRNRTRFGLFAALECPERHGHLHSHSGLLAERGLVRPLGLAERRALAQERHRICCLNCGAPATRSDDNCSYCGTALVVIDLPRLSHSLRL
ncbi:MAG TPA: zf-TFIIB domain-containing protein, partial [Burkholderiaceae bacterium]|nr:zf-TFIIB domain-containing protein [Burkholderiaceae bacterium]